MDMIKVKIGKFRDNLSAYLAKVRRGQEVTIYDRETPIGKLVPCEEVFDPFEGVTGPEVPGGLRGLHFPKRTVSIDPVQLIREDRDARDDFLFRQLSRPKNPLK